MTAVAVVTPSSGSNSAATPFVEAAGLPWVVGADTCPSLFVAPGPRGPCPENRCALLLWRPCASCIRGDRSSIEAPGNPIPRTGSVYAREPLPRTGPLVGAAGVVGLVRRVPHERGDRPETVPSTCLPAQTE